MGARWAVFWEEAEVAGERVRVIAVCSATQRKLVVGCQIPSANFVKETKTSFG